MKLNTIFKEANDIEILQLIDDSREVSNKGLYFARKGFNFDGHNFINGAIENGAVAIVHSDEVINKIDGIEYILVDDVVAALHHACNVFYDYPSHKMKIHGITGTNGKSTTMKTLYNMLRRFGVNAAYVGTVSVEYGDLILPPGLSTPDILPLYKLYDDMVKNGVTDVCQEVSSQGLDLRRVDSIKFNDASYTNLSHDHLDFHKTMEEYYQAKHRFFEIIAKDTTRIVNIDDEHGALLAKENPEHTLTYAIDNEADYQAIDLDLGGDKTVFTLKYKNNEYKVISSLVARFNVYNVLNVIAIMHNDGYELERIIKELETIQGVEGRLDVIDEGQDFSVFVDYAHSPDSFKVVFEYLNSIKQKGKRLISVFGGTGNRDKEKRPMTAALATAMCDYVIITEVDNRFEKTEDIIADVVSGVVNDNYEVVVDRVEAVTKAVNIAQSGDIVVLLGKGQERVLQRGSVFEPFIGDDIAAKNALKERLNESK